MDKKKLFVFLFLLIVFVLWSLLLVFYSPHKIVEHIGITNAYLFLTVIAFIGGTSIFLPFPYYIFTITFGGAGLNPLLLGLAAGLGTLMGDSISYYIAYRGRDVVPRKSSKFFKKIFDWLVKKHPMFMPLFAFFYAALIPLPDDLIMVPAGITRYPFLRLAVSVGLGKIISNTILAFSGLYGWNLFFG